MTGWVGAAVQGAAGIVVLAFEMIAARLAEINRVGEVRALGFRNFAQTILLFVRFNILPSGFDFFVAADAKAVMIVEALLRGIRAAFVDDQPPIGVRVLQYHFIRFPFFNFHRQQVGEDRQRFSKRAAFIVAGDETRDFEHIYAPEEDELMTIKYLPRVSAARGSC